ncbi:hypothetical protein Pst134EA_015073 [Puccinia striiformis f. sp. tritici]|nr:hypothetical protein Pst134EA_015073 [Puccinia striiformis f. sp. tritici]KAH9462984.1 hypothetical protein Pst134EA_015073 [Puccinia striiformis f. sp. tritici]
MQGKLMKMGRAFRFALVCGVRIQSLTATSKPDTPFGVDVALVGSMQGLAEHNPSDSSAEPARLLSLFPTYPGPSLSGQGSFSAPTEHSGATMKTLNLLRDANSNPQHESRKRKIPGNMQLSEGVVADREAHLLSSGKETFKLLDSRSAFRPYKTPRISLLGSSRSAFRQWNGKGASNLQSLTYSPGVNPMLESDRRGASHLDGKNTISQSHEAIEKARESGFASRPPSRIISPLSARIDTPEQLQNLDGMITGRRWDGIDSGLSDGIHSAIASLPGDGKAVKEFNLGHLDFRFWAWISIIYVHVGGQVAAEVDVHAKSILRALEKACLSQNGYHTSHMMNVVQAPYRNYELRNQITDFATSLWAVNLRILEVLGATRSTNIYFEEQKRLIQWFTSFMLTCHQFAFAGPSKRGMFEPWIGNEGFPLYQKIIDAMQPMIEDKALYEVYRENLTPKILTVSKSQALMNKAVVNILGFYYKNTNLKKWSYLFEEDRNFIIKFSNFGSEWKDRPYQKLLPVEYHTRTPVGDILPWSEPTRPEVILSCSDYLKGGLVKVERWVSPVALMGFSDVTPAEIRHFEVRNVFFMEEQDERIWAWISRMKIQGKNELPEVYKPDFQLMRAILTKKLELASRQNFQDKEAERRFLSVTDKQARARLEKLFDLLWAVNEQFLESIGCEIGGEKFYREQKLVQTFLQFMIQEENRGGSKNQLEVLLDQNRRLAVETPYKTPGDLIMELLLLKKNNELYRIKHAKCAKITIVSEMDIIMTKIVVAVLGFYYKNENYGKWKLMFTSDKNLFRWLVRSSTRTYYSSGTNFNKNPIFAKVRALQLIPWNEALENPSESHSEEFDRFLSHRPPMIHHKSYIEKVTDKA